MASSGFGTDDVLRLREKLDEGGELDREDREKLVAILDAVSAGARAAPGTSTDAEIGNEELRDLLAQLRDAFSPGTNPGSVTLVNTFKIIPPPPPPPPPGVPPAYPGDGGA
jgi:hypothetical protein